MRHTYAIPVWNRRDLVGRAIDSALAVEGSKVRVIDNASDDGTWELLQARRDDRLHVERNPRNLGLFGNLDRCLEHDGEDALTILCSDDLALPGFSDEAGAVIDERVALVMGSGRFVDIEGRVLGPFADQIQPGRHPQTRGRVLALLFRCYINVINYPSGWYVPSRVVAVNGGFDHGMRLAADLDWVLRALRHGDLVVTRSPACSVTRHPGQLSDHMKRRHAFTWIREYLTLARRHDDAFRQIGLHSSAFIARSLASMSLVWSIRYALAGKRLGACLHLAFFMRVRCGLVAKFTALLVFALLRASATIGRIRIPPSA